MGNPRAIFNALVRPGSHGHTRLVSQPALELIKALRSEGCLVVIEPDDGSKIEYYIRKGALDFLKDPLFLVLVGIPIAFFVNIASAVFYDRWLKKRPVSPSGIVESPQQSNLVVEVQGPGESFYYDHNGLRIELDRAREAVTLLGQQAAVLSAMRTAESPYPDMPFPICLEHTSRIVGWANLREDEKGLLVSPGVISDRETWSRIERGELRGFSIAGAVRESQCSLCNADYAECNHISGLDYEGRSCSNIIRDVDLVEVSIVEEPINPGCLVNLLKNYKE